MQELLVDQSVVHSTLTERGQTLDRVLVDGQPQHHGYWYNSTERNWRKQVGPLSGRMLNLKLISKIPMKD